MRTIQKKSLCIIVWMLAVLIGCMSVQAQETADGTYMIEAKLEGGSGRAHIESPAEVTVEAGIMTAKIIFSSPYYDYMIVDKEKYEPVNTEGNSTFLIPIPALEGAVEVIADTTAMSEHHEIDYQIVFGAEEQEVEDEEPEEELAPAAGDAAGEHEILEISGLTYDHSMELSYATQFAVDYYQDEYAVITVAEKDRYLLVPEGKEAPEGLDGEIKVLLQPLDHIYLVASSAMDLIIAADGLDNVVLSGLSEDRWYIEEAVQAMQEKKMVYAGKYSAPDYERILAGGCDLAIESTMIYHSPDVQEKLEGIGIPVFVEHSSYEKHPLGRTEWIRLYGVLLGKAAEADTFFEEKKKEVESIAEDEFTGKTVAFFSMNSNGSVTVRKTGDYVSKMIELAGGEYVFQDLGNEDALATMNMQLEHFYAGAQAADYLIYNSTIEDELGSMDDFLAKSPLLSTFEAVKNGNVWCTGKSMFQATTGIADMIVDLHDMLRDEDRSLEELRYMKKLK